VALNAIPVETVAPTSRPSMSAAAFPARPGCAPQSLPQSRGWSWGLPRRTRRRPSAPPPRLADMCHGDFGEYLQGAVAYGVIVPVVDQLEAIEIDNSTAVGW
jgi:hypothetical protein